MRLPGMLITAAGVVTFLVAAPTAAAEPPPNYDGQSASAAIADLESQGYDVQVNYLNGSSKPLPLCRVAGVTDPNSSPPAPGAFTTIYVDVECPNHDDGGDFGISGSIG